MDYRDTMHGLPIICYTKVVDVINVYPLTDGEMRDFNPLFHKNHQYHK